MKIWCLHSRVPTGRPSGSRTAVYKAETILRTRGYCSEGPSCLPSSVFRPGRGRIQRAIPEDVHDSQCTARPQAAASGSQDD
jgi:hypothetical protein